MSKKLSDIINFYQQNDIDEIYLEKSINRFTEKNIKIDKKSTISKNKSSEKNIDKSINKSSPEPKNISNVKLAKIEHKDFENDSKNNSEKTDIIDNLNNKFVPLKEIIASAELLAKSAKNLADLKNIIENFDGCNLKKMATNTVFGDGNINAKIMVIGEAPGNQEDIEGIPFCGDSGELLDGIFKSINLTRAKDFFITNAIYWRPPGNRRPTDEELSICRPFVERTIELFAPKIIVLVGSTAMNCLIQTNETISDVRGRLIDYSPNFLPNGCKILTIFHPSYLMRQPSKKKLAWKDMLNLKKFIDENYEN